MFEDDPDWASSIPPSSSSDSFGVSPNDILPLDYNVPIIPGMILESRVSNNEHFFLSAPLAPKLQCGYIVKSSNRKRYVYIEHPALERIYNNDAFAQITITRVTRSGNAWEIVDHFPRHRIRLDLSDKQTKLNVKPPKVCSQNHYEKGEATMLVIDIYTPSTYGADFNLITRMTTGSFEVWTKHNLLKK